jgi:hypothetical protein
MNLFIHRYQFLRGEISFDLRELDHLYTHCKNTKGACDTCVFVRRHVFKHRGKKISVKSILHVVHILLPLWSIQKLYYTTNSKSIGNIIMSVPNLHTNDPCKLAVCPMYT